ncbi:MAG TPA: T9SS type A sorting domain-containing protein [Bacteroidales bacterium]|nr:T9SS type A sorting domain-containing protein [Bacteroidales bacterium]
MKKSVIILSFLLLSSTFIYSQPLKFSKVLSSVQTVQASCIRPAENDAYIISGSAGQRGLILKSDLNGNVIWNKTFYNYTHIYPDICFKSIVVSNDSSYVAAGSCYDSLSSRTSIFCLKLNFNGDVIWSKTLKFTGLESTANSIQQTLDSGYIITGYGCLNNGNDNRIILAKLDISGILQWAKQLISGSNDEIGLSVIQAPDSGFLLTGYNTYSGDPILTKLTQDGMVSWSKIFQPSVSGNNYNSVYTGDGIVFNSSGILIKLDFSGNILWNKVFNTTMPFNYCQIVPGLYKTSDGGFAFISESECYNSSIIKTDSNGNLNWAKNLAIIASDVIETNDKGFMVLGNGPMCAVKSGEYSKDDSFLSAGLIKMDSLGNGLDCVFDKNVDSDTGTIGVVPNVYTLVDGATISTFNTIIDPIVVNSSFGCVPWVGGISDIKTENSIIVLPNPTTGKINIQTSQHFGKIKTVEIFDGTGQLRKLITDKFTDTDIGFLASGLYFIVVTNFDNERLTGKIIKE